MKILIIEDEVKVANNLRDGLLEHGYDTMVAYDGDMGQRLLNQHSFDLMICDVILPGKSGFTICQEVRKVNQQIKVILLTALDSIDDKVEGLDSGADDYMVKPFDLRELLARIKVLNKRNSSDQERSETLKIHDLLLDPNRKSARRGGKEISLTAKEYSLLHYLIQNKRKVVSRMSITEKVWDIDFDPGTNVVDVYINILRKKIDKDFDCKLIHTRVGMGYILTDEIA